MVRMNRKNQMTRKAWKNRKIRMARMARMTRMAHGENRQTNVEQYMKHQVNTIYKYA